ncbi:MAG: V-type ATP synthase subunit E [Coriobacteriia bacterium]|nr:V-type ATP synthase subunit E [Coriobacteriia bacterium]
MALDDIFRALDEQADKEIEQILTDARDHAKAIGEEADEQGNVIRQTTADATEKAVRERATRSMNAARLQGKKRVASVKEESVRGAFEAATARLGEMRSESEYPAIFRTLAEEALQGLNGEVEVLVDKADVALAERTVADLGLSAKVKPELKTSGGLAVRTGGGRIMRRNTFEDRLEKAEKLIQAEVAEILFP